MKVISNSVKSFKPFILKKPFTDYTNLLFCFSLNSSFGIKFRDKFIELFEFVYLFKQMYNVNILSYNTDTNILNIHENIVDLFNEFIKSKDVIVYDEFNENYIFDSTIFYKCVYNEENTLIINLSFLDGMHVEYGSNLNTSLMLVTDNIHVVHISEFGGLILGPSKFILEKNVNFHSITKSLNEKYNIAFGYPLIYENTDNISEELKNDVREASIDDLVFNYCVINKSMNIKEIKNELDMKIENNLLNLMIENKIKLNLLHHNIELTTLTNKAIEKMIVCGLMMDIKLKNSNQKIKLLNNIYNFKKSLSKININCNITENDCVKFNVKTSLNTILGHDFDVEITLISKFTSMYNIFNNNISGIILAQHKKKRGIVLGLLPVHPYISKMNYRIIELFIAYSFGQHPFNYHINMGYGYITLTQLYFTKYLITNKYTDTLDSLLHTLPYIKKILVDKTFINNFITTNSFRSKYNINTYASIMFSTLFYESIKLDDIIKIVKLIAFEYFRKYICRNVAVKCDELYKYNSTDILKFMNSNENNNYLLRLEQLLLIPFALRQEFNPKIYSDWNYNIKYNNKTPLKSIAEILLIDYDNFLVLNFLMGVIYKKNNIMNEYFNYSELNHNSLDETMKYFKTKLNNMTFSCIDL
jgi:hypothetical protein